MLKAFLSVFIIITLLPIFPGISFAKEIRQGFDFKSNHIRPRKTDEIIVNFKNPPRVKDLIAVSQKAPGITPRHGVYGTKAMVYKVAGSVDTSIAALANDPNIEAVTPNGQMQMLELPNDEAIVSTPFPGRPEYQWNMYKLNLAGQGLSGWNLSHGSSAVKVAVIDSGVDMNHQDLAGKIVEMADCAGVSACTPVTTMTDTSGHGTHVAGMVAAATNNGLDVAGAGYDTRLVILKVLRSDGSIMISDFVNAIRFAADRGVSVINLSIGATTGNLNNTLLSAINSAVAYAWGKGILVVAAAGNCGGPASGHVPSGDSCDVFDNSGNFVSHEVNPKVYPAASLNVLSIAAVAIDNNMAKYSERNDSGNASIGNWISVAAPGGDSNTSCRTSTTTGGDGYNCILSLWKSNSLAYNMGTSMASPQVAGVAALLFAAKPGISAAQVKQVIETTANKSVARPQTINGLVDALAALTSVVGALSPTPSPTLPATLTPTSTPFPSQIPSATPFQTRTPTPTRIPNATLTPTRPSTPTPTRIPNATLTPTRNPVASATPRVGGGGRPTDVPKLPKTPPDPYPTGPYCSND